MENAAVLRSALTPLTALSRFNLFSRFCTISASYYPLYYYTTKPGKWNAHVQYAWRYDPCELTPQGAARPPPRAPRLDPVDPWVTDDEYDPSDDFE